MGSARGRGQVSGLPGRWPWWRIGAVLVALLSVPAIIYTGYAWVFTPLQRYYFGQLVAGAFSEYAPWVRSEQADYRLVELVSRKVSGRALPRSVRAGETKLSDGLVLPFELVEDARRQGFRLRVVKERLPSAELRAWMARDIYGLPLSVQLGSAALFGLGVLWLGLTVAGPKDRERARVRQAIGEVERGRIRESRTNSFPNERSSRSALERVVQPLLLPSEVNGLPALPGYLKSGHLVVPLDVKLIVLTGVAEGFSAREPKAPGQAPGPPPAPEPAPVLQSELPAVVKPAREQERPAALALPVADDDSDPYVYFE